MDFKANRGFSEKITIENTASFVLQSESENSFLQKNRNGKIMHKKRKNRPRGSFSERAKLLILIGASAVLADIAVVAYIWFARVGEEAAWLITHMPTVAEHLLLTLLLCIGGAILLDLASRKMK